MDEEHVEAAFDAFQRVRRFAWSLPLEEAAALSERVRVELMINKEMNGGSKKFFRAYCEFLDEIVEERMEKEKKPRESFHDHILRYIRGIIDPDVN